jgi:DNA polymerase I-like protein with 3'-5' exonuclease and polymerase domains
MGDEDFTRALVSGKKEDGTDPHTLNKIKLGLENITRENAKTFIYAWILGAGIPKVAKILGCSRGEAEFAVDNFIRGYPGLQRLRDDVIPFDKKRGYIKAIDGRLIKINPDWHFGQVLGGYLQSGETIVMKMATLQWKKELTQQGIDFILVNLVHDEWQTETRDNDYDANTVASVQSNAIKSVGDLLGLGCPLLGTAKEVEFDGRKQIGGYNWYDTH